MDELLRAHPGVGGGRGGLVTLALWLLAAAWAEPADEATPSEVAEALGVWLGADRTDVPDDARAEAEKRVAASLGDAALADGGLAAACGAGDQLACVGAAWQLGFVDGRPSAEAPDPAAAALAAESACAKGHLRACVAHARLAQRGIGTEADPEGAATRFRAACDRGEPRGCLWLAKAHQVGLGVPRDPAETRRRAEAACTDTHPAGCNSLALALHLGTGGDKDLGRALQLYQQACDGGFAPACDNLGPLYQGGLPGVADRVPLLRSACEATPPQTSACAHLGQALAATDPAAAMGPLRRACDDKLARGCDGVAQLVLDGRRGTVVNEGGGMEHIDNPRN